MDSQTQNNTGERTINLKDIFMQFVKHWFIAAMVIVVCLVIAFLYTNIIRIPQYSSTAKILIAKRINENTTSSDFSVSTYFTMDYVELIADRAVLEDVIDQLDLDYSYGELKSRIHINNPQDTRILEVTVTTDNPRLSQKIAQSVCEVAKNKIVELFNVDFVNIMSDANLPTSSSSRSLQSNMIVALAFGVVLVVVIMFIFNAFDDKLNGTDDVEKILGLCVLGAIPYANNHHQPRKYAYSKKE